MDLYKPDHNHYAFRVFTSLSLVEVYEKIIDCLDKPVKKIEPQYSAVVGRETDSARLHYHAYLIFNLPHKTVLARLKKVFVIKGNKDYSFVSVEKPVSKLSYVIKEADYLCTPDLKELVANSPKWVSEQEYHETFDKELFDLADKYLTTDMSDYNYLLKLLELNSKYSKNIYVAHIRAQWLGLANQRNLPLNKSGFRMSGNSRPFRHILIEEIMRGYAIFDN